MEYGSHQTFAAQPQQANYQFVPCATLPGYLSGADPAVIDAVTNAFINALLDAGWAGAGTGGEPGRMIAHGDLAFNADRVIRDLALGRMPVEQWTQACISAGITNVQVAVPYAAPPAQYAAVPAATGAPGAPIWEVPGKKPGHGRRVLVSVLSVLLVLSFAGYRVYKQGVFGGSGKMKADGASNLPGKGAALKYSPRAGDYEYWSVGRSSGQGASAGEWRVRHSTATGESFIGIELDHWDPPVTTEEDADDWASWKNDQYSAMAGHEVTYFKDQFAGRTAYIWDFTTSDGNWRHGVWVPAAKDSFGFACLGDRSDALDVFKRQCLDAIATGTIKSN
ncbi:MAG: hypothetical protein ACRDKI_02270 [Solirubrobacterales bacterium]